VVREDAADPRAQHHRRRGSFACRTGCVTCTACSRMIPRIRGRSPPAPPSGSCSAFTLHDISGVILGEPGARLRESFSSRCATKAPSTRLGDRPTGARARLDTVTGARTKAISPIPVRFPRSQGRRARAAAHAERRRGRGSPRSSISGRCSSAARGSPRRPSRSSNPTEHPPASTNAAGTGPRASRRRPIRPPTRAYRRGADKCWYPHGLSGDAWRARRRR